MKDHVRGRPLGSYGSDDADKSTLKKVARKLVRAQSNSPTAAIKEIIGEDQESDLRRLQRRWSRDGDKFIREAREPFFHARWELDAQSLKESSPELYQTLKNFSQSQGGKKLLLQKGDGTKPVHFMSLGVGRLNQIMKTEMPHGSEKAHKEFGKQLSGWRKFGFEPDTDFLKTFAQLCIAEAEQAEKNRSKRAGHKS